MPTGGRAGSPGLHGAAKAAHEAKLAREGGQEGGGAPGPQQQRGGSPGRGYDQYGNLVGAAKAAHEAKLAREGGGGEEFEEEGFEGGGGQQQKRGGSPGRGYDSHGNLVGAAKAAKEGHLMGAAARQHQAKMQREGAQQR